MRVAFAFMILALAGCDRGTLPSGPGSSTKVVAKPPEPPVAAVLEYPLDVAVAGGHVWVSASDRDVVLIDPGKPARIVKSFGWVNALAADDGGAWVSANDELGGKTVALWRITPTGEATRVAEGIKYVTTAPGGIIVWTEHEAFFRNAAGAEQSLGPPVGRLRLDGNMMYTADDRYQVLRMPLDAGPWDRLGAFPDVIEGFDVDATSIYASVNRGIGVMSNNGGPVRMLAENLDDPRELAADGKGGVYVITYGTHSDFWGHSSNRDGALLHVDAAGTVTPLAADFIGAGRIALTADTIYVTDVYGGRVLAVPRR